jgi:alkylation response protein AidB-like acyl-CoA dehydrogenase
LKTVDFNDTAEEAAYRAGVRAWLEDNFPKQGFRREEDGERVNEAKAWQAKKAVAGFACITWPTAWGGPGGANWQAQIFAQEEARLITPPAPLDPFLVGLGMCIPTIMTCGAEADKQRFVGPAMRGEEIWCQLFSEPSGGSDVAGARTRALLAADGSGDWIVNGQKVWTTGAQFADFGMVICRTDPDVPKHKGLTMFWLDMRDPAIEVRPIHQVSEASGFNEVFFTDLRLPDSQRIGAVGDGWRVSLVTLMNERNSVGSGVSYERQIIELASSVATLAGPALKDGGLREKLADWYVQAEGLRLTRLRAQTALSRGETPGPEASIGKLVNAAMMQDVAAFAMDLEDQFGIISDPATAPLAALFQRTLLVAPGSRIAGGTDEIMRNIIAERVLGLPPDVRVDKDVPFNDIPTRA